MKRLLFIFTLICLFALPSLAADLTFAWDNPTSQAWNNVRIYEKVGATYTVKVEVAGSVTTATVTNVQPGVHTYVARSYMNAVESADSNAVGSTVNPDNPSNFRMALFEVEVGQDGSITVKSVKFVEIPSEFFRAG